MSPGTSPSALERSPRAGALLLSAPLISVQISIPMDADPSADFFPSVRGFFSSSI